MDIINDCETPLTVDPNNEPVEQSLNETDCSLLFTFDQCLQSCQDLE